MSLPPATVNDAPLSPRAAGLAYARPEQWAADYERMTFRQFLARVREDYAAHGGDWTLPGFRAVAVHRFGNWRMNVRPKLLRFPLSVLYRALYRLCRNHYGIELDYAVRLGRRVVIEHQHGIVIHGNAVIGDDCVIRHGVTLGVKSVDRPYEAPTLGRGVDVGAGAKILGPVHVSDGARVGANAVVLRDVPAGATAVGIPARVIEKAEATT